MLQECLHSLTSSLHEISLPYLMVVKVTICMLLGNLETRMEEVRAAYEEEKLTLINNHKTEMEEGNIYYLRPGADLSSYFELFSSGNHNRT